MNPIIILLVFLRLNQKITAEEHGDGADDDDKLININVITWKGSNPYVIQENGNKTKGIIPLFFNELGSACPVKHIKVVIKTTCRMEYVMFINILQNNTKPEQSSCDLNKPGEVTVFSPAPPLSHVVNFLSVPVLKANSVGVIVDGNDISLLSKVLVGIQSSQVIIYIVILFSVIVGAIIWALEHRVNSSFDVPFSRGLWSGFWFAFVTMTTVGYGDKVPKHFLSRIVIVIWAIGGILLTAMITAIVMDKVASDIDLSGEDIAVLRDYSEKSLARTILRGNMKEFDSYNEALLAVLDRSNNNRRVKAALIETNIIAKYLQVHPKLVIGREIHKDVSIYLYIYRSDELINSTRNFVSCLQNDYDNLLNDIKNKHVSSYDVSRYLIKPIDESFDINYDSGVLVYITIPVFCLIATAVLLEVWAMIRKDKQTISLGNRCSSNGNEPESLERDVKEMKLLIERIELKLKEVPLQ